MPQSRRFVDSDFDSDSDDVKSCQVSLLLKVQNFPNFSLPPDSCLPCLPREAFFADVEHDLSGGYCHECEEHHHILSVDETGLGCARFRRVWSS